ncbi:MAG: DUF192 domain-containing protein [Alcaligenaceae bacterium]|jgi:uncharacterized membrane protein (UPF0127 family)|nr:DUF192 domain-containing protein [Alcaligenaceae bacterium]
MPYFRQIFLGLSLSIISFITPNESLAQVQSQTANTTLELKPLRIGGVPLLAEVADTNRSRQRGLMHRPFLAEHRAMLFVFSEPQQLCFWMRNTLIPLSIAYIDEHAKVIDIFDMQPLDENSICSSSPTQFALEVNQGWFERHKVQVGDLLQSGDWRDTEAAERALQ